jgi:pimeloyl-ACP methyl ester carboxylesterase
VFTPSHRGGSGPPLVLLHGFLDSWHTWELVLPTLERHHDVLAPTLPGHAGGPAYDGDLAGAVERAMDEAGFETAYIAGNSLGGYVALQLAERGRARSVVAFAPGGGWAEGRAPAALLEEQARVHEQVRRIAPRARAALATPESRRRATQLITVNYEHIPVDLLVHLTLAVASAKPVDRMLAAARDDRWRLDAERIDVLVRIVWGTEDALLPWPSAAERYRTRLLPHADWVVLDGVGHCPQLDVPLESAQLILGFTS